MNQQYTPLTDEQVHEIAFEYFALRANKTIEQEEPRLVLVGGQPGAGKSQASVLAKTELRRQGGYIHIDADRMRERIPLGNNRPSSEQTQKDAGRLVHALRNLAVTNRRNILEEGTYRDASGAEKFVLGKKAQGYKVEMLAVATPHEQSLLGIYNRYELQHQAGANNPRMVPEAYHDEAIKGFDNTLAQAENILDRVRVIDRGGKVLFDSQKQRGGALQALAMGRELTDEKLKETEAVWIETREMAAQRDAPFRYQAMLCAHHARIKAIQKEREGVQRDHDRPDRAVSFEQLPETQAIERHPELMNAYKCMDAATQFFEAKMPGNAPAQIEALEQVRKQVQLKLDQGEIKDFRAAVVASEKQISHMQQRNTAPDRER